MPHYELLSGAGLTWIPSSNGNIPGIIKKLQKMMKLIHRSTSLDGAVSSGNTSSGEPLYIGRAHHEGSLTPGKIVVGHGCIYIPFNGKEEPSLHYDVLVGQQKGTFAIRDTSSEG